MDINDCVEEARVAEFVRALQDCELRLSVRSGLASSGSVDECGVLPGAPHSQDPLELCGLRRLVASSPSCATTARCGARCLGSSTGGSWPCRSSATTRTFCGRLPSDVPCKAQDLVRGLRGGGTSPAES
eukprot:TRINITY_DN7468_c0_g1_i2.p2 TRINITY_DN7468_c0_g1~~TRINITY_DN7468_c0_g1_i2.p2  ORF type:complete len:129 (-),score=11.93 TRINITY_DN7468_c0_g1_i2:97-483(-)